MGKRWYVVTTYSGFENSVKQDLERRIESYNMSNIIYQVMVPEETIEVVNEETSENTEQEDDSDEEETTDNVTFNN